MCGGFNISIFEDLIDRADTAVIRQGAPKQRCCSPKRDLAYETDSLHSSCGGHAIWFSVKTAYFYTSVVSNLVSQVG